MNIEAWAFLVSRNPYIDYRTIVAPDFICAAGIPKLLARAADGELTEIGHAICRIIEGSDVGDFTIIFRVIEAQANYINSTEGNNILKDSFGREIYLIEGIVIKGTDKVSITKEDLEIAHEQVRASYQKFWGYTDIPIVESSSCFNLQSLESKQDSDLLNIEEIQPLKVNSKRKSIQRFSWKLEKKICLDFRVSSIAFSPNEDKIVIRGYNPFVEIWDLNNYKIINSVNNRLAIVDEFDHDRAVAFSPDGKLIAFSAVEELDRNKILLWNVKTWEEEDVIRGRQFIGAFTRIHAISFSNDGNFLASASNDKTVKLWDTITKEQYALLQHKNPVYAIAFSPTDSILASGNSKGCVELWDIKGKHSLNTFESKELSSINSVAFSSDSLTLAVGGNSRSDKWIDETDAKYLEILDVKKMETIWFLEGHKAPVNSVAFSSNSQILASGSSDGNVKLWNVNSGQEILTLSPQTDEGLTSEITSVAFSPDGQLLASSTIDGCVTIWRS